MSIWKEFYLSNFSKGNYHVLIPSLCSCLILAWKINYLSHKNGQKMRKRRFMKKWQGLAIIFNHINISSSIMTQITSKNSLRYVLAMFHMILLIILWHISWIHYSNCMTEMNFKLLDLVLGQMIIVFGEKIFNNHVTNFINWPLEPLHLI